MELYLIIGLLALVLWSFFAERLARAHISGPLVMLVVGVVLGFAAQRHLEDALDSRVAEHIVVLILALILFADATEVRGGLLGGERGPALRLLLIALPVSLILGVFTGILLFPDLSVGVLIALACVVMPTDLAPAAAIVRDKRIPTRLRNILNVESGYNDGIIAPIFAFGLILAGANNAHADSAGEALASLIPASAVAIAIGAAVGLAGALLTNLSQAHDLGSPQALRVSILVLPVLTYELTAQVEANGFVAAFAAGLVYRAVRRSKAEPEELTLVDDVGIVTTYGMWFVLGLSVAIMPAVDDEWRIFLYGFLAVTVLRIAPVVLSLIGTDLAMVDRLVVGLLGPRGTATIVFGLLAYNGLAGTAADVTLYVMAATVVISIGVHGVAATLVARGFRRIERRRTRSLKRRQRRRAARNA
ncbi:cation:proton antiporter [Williamsia sp. CHRR-6]|uniref:cation:proton antiporter domain-containing protein n=1 Tax=Williamsia sp. CHRR-6 TaxID=2835871 RepID=UPI001BDAAA7C|nr:cation:proton antiporter [Williamsia sp. CHRR-6]MBT0566358.1 cation:proton antiporter [Williamsia sp. CHRR-6]